MKQSNKFLKKHHLWGKRLTAEIIESVIKTQGFKIIRYSYAYNPPEIDELLKSIGLLGYSKTVTSFTYITRNEKFVFVANGINGDDLLFALLHEEGHIFCDHPFKDGLFDNTQTAKEREASIFAEEILKNRGKVLKTRVFLAILALSIGLSFPLLQQNENVIPQSPDTVYVTPSGTKYHPAGCYHIKSKNNVTAINIEKAKELGYEPCVVWGEK